MKRRDMVVALPLILAAALVQAPPAAASTVWDVTGGPFTIGDGSGGTASISITNLTIDGSTASGRVQVSDGRYTCSSQNFSGTAANFFTAMYEPCTGTVTFTVDPGTGALTVSPALVMASRVFSGVATGTSTSVARPPTVVPLQGCTATTDTASGAIAVNWTPNPDATSYEVAASGLAAPVVASGTSTGAAVPFSQLPPGAPIAASVTAKRTDGQTVATCTSNEAWTPPAAPVIDTMVPVAAGGLLTVNYALPKPVGIQGIEYRVDTGQWTRPGGVAPVNGVGGTFTLAGLASGDVTVTLRSIGADAGGPLTTESTPSTATIPAPPPSRPGSPPVATGSSPTRPTPPAPPAPVTDVPGTSNGAGTGTNGALAATVGDAGIDAPCLAADGTLYANQYATVGSQHTMAPNTRGLGTARSFTVVAGALPPGMQLDRTAGVLFGVPTQAGTWVTTVRARFTGGGGSTSQFTTRVDPDPRMLQYAAQNIAVVGTPITIAPTTNAPTAGTTYALVCGELPAGTRLDARTGRITGTPTATVARPTPLRIAQTSATGTAAASFIVVVDRAGATSISYPAHPHVRAGSRVVIRPTVVGVGEIAVFRMWKGKLPKGLHLNRRTGVITGRIAHGGRPHTITIVAVTQAGALITATPMRLTLKPRSR